MFLLLSALLLAPDPPAPALTVPIGYCSSLKEIDAVRAAGFDYVELRTSDVAALPDAEFEKLAEDLERRGPPVSVTYTFIPEIGYAGRMSVEARSADFAAEAPRSIAFLRAAFAR